MGVCVYVHKRTSGGVVGGCGGAYYMLLEGGVACKECACGVCGGI